MNAAAIMDRLRKLGREIAESEDMPDGWRVCVTVTLSDPKRKRPRITLSVDTIPDDDV